MFSGIFIKKVLFFRNSDKRSAGFEYEGKIKKIGEKSREAHKYCRKRLMQTF